MRCFLVSSAKSESWYSNEEIEFLLFSLSGRKSFVYLPPVLKKKKMKQGIHPESYRLVVFKDMSNEYAFIGKSTTPTKDTIKWEDGNEYPLVKVEISHTSHPFFTGKMQLVDTAGRIDKFKSRYAKFDKKK